MNIENLEKWHFELTEGACNYLLDLVLKGQKKATSSSVLGYQIEGEEIPKEGNLSVITDWDGNPRCVIKTTRVRIIPYKDMTFDIANLKARMTLWNPGEKIMKSSSRKKARTLDISFLRKWK